MTTRATFRPPSPDSRTTDDSSSTQPSATSSAKEVRYLGHIVGNNNILPTRQAGVPG